MKKKLITILTLLCLFPLNVSALTEQEVKETEFTYTDSVNLKNIGDDDVDMAIFMYGIAFKEYFSLYRDYDHDTILVEATNPTSVYVLTETLKKGEFTTDFDDVWKIIYETLEKEDKIPENFRIALVKPDVELTKGETVKFEDILISRKDKKIEYTAFNGIEKD